MPNPAERENALDSSRSDKDENLSNIPGYLQAFGLELENLNSSAKKKGETGAGENANANKDSLPLFALTANKRPSPWVDLRGKSSISGDNQQLPSLEIQPGKSAHKAAEIEKKAEKPQVSKPEKNELKSPESSLAEAVENTEEGKDPQRSLPSLSIDLGTVLPALESGLEEFKKQTKEKLDLLGELIGDLDLARAAKDKSDKAASPSEFRSHSGSWRRENDSWKFYDRKGKEQTKYESNIQSVQQDNEGNCCIKLENGRTIKEKPSGGVLEYNQDMKLEKISYADGSSRSFKFDGDELIEMISKSGQYNRAKDSNGKYTNEWIKSGQQTGWKGEISVDQNKGELTVGNITYKSDLSVEKRNEDGSKEISFPNKDLVKLDKRGLVSEISYADGSKRKFGWQENPQSKSEQDRFKLNLLTVEKKDNTYRHTLQENGSWSVQTLKNGSWSKAESETLSFEMDSKSFAYSYTDSQDGIKHVTEPGAVKKQISPDGLELAFKDDKIISARKNDKLREFTWNDDKLTAVYDGIQGKTWTEAEDGTWRSNKGDKESGSPFIGADGEFGFKNNERSVVFKTDGSRWQRLEIGKSRIDIKEGQVDLKAEDGSIRSFKTDNNGEDLIAESLTRNGKTESWSRAEKLPNGNHIWVNDQDPSKREERSLVRQNSGKLSIEYGDGRKYEASIDGQEKLENPAEKWSIQYKSGQPVESKFPDGTIRQYKFDGPGEEPSSIEVKSADGKLTTITKIKDGQYNYKWPDGEMKWNANFTVSRDGTYKYVDHDEKEKSVTRYINGLTVTEKPDEKSRVEKFGNEISKVVIDGKTVEAVRDENKDIVELKDSAANSTYKKNKDGTWQVSALDKNKPFVQADNLLRSGDLVLDESGSADFIDSDGKLIRQAPGQKGELVSSKEKALEAALANESMDESQKESLRKAILDHASREDIEPRQKAILQESLAKFAARKDISNAEKAASYMQLQRLLDSKSDKAFNKKERAELAGQLIWHMANPDKNQQGGNPNCQVTVIRGKLLWEQPSEFARMMTDVIETGEFVTKDKSVIKVPLACCSAGKDTEEASFPPEDGKRTWLGKISDLTCANIFWQRQTRTPQGESVSKGHLIYRQDPPEKGKESGAGVWKIPGDGYMYKVKNSSGKELEYPSLYAKDIASVYKQITGSNKNSILVHGRLSGGEGVEVVNKDSLHKFLSENKSGTHIVQIWTGTDWVWKDVPRFKPGESSDEKDSEHVLLLKDYDPKSRTVAVDNSWSAKYDRFISGRRISLEELYKAMAKID